MHLLVRHRVRDFDVWKAVFDSHALDQQESGLEVEWVRREADDPLNVFLFFRVTDRAAAEAFMAAPEAAAAAEESGVTDDAEIWFLD